MRAFYFRDGVLLLCPHPTDVVRAPSGVSLIRAPILCHCSVTQLGPAQLCSVVRPYGLQRTPILLITSSPSKNFTPKPPHNEIKSSIYGFLVAQAVKNLLTMHENRALGQRSPGEGHGNPLQYSCLENSMDRRTWQATAHGVAKNQTQLSD